MNILRRSSNGRMTAVRRAVDRLLAGELGPLLDLLAEDVEFEVASGGDVPGCRKDSGKQPVADYFTALGGLRGVLADGLHREGRAGDRVGQGELHGRGRAGSRGDASSRWCSISREGMITRLLVIEDLGAFMRGGGSLVEARVA